jgi:hypothetical protein
MIDHQRAMRHDAVRTFAEGRLRVSGFEPDMARRLSKSSPALVIQAAGAG